MQNKKDQVKPSFIRIDDFLKQEKQHLDGFRKWWAQQRRTQNVYDYPSELPDFEWFNRYLDYCDSLNYNDDYQDDQYSEYNDFDEHHIGGLHGDHEYDD